MLFLHLSGNRTLTHEIFSFLGRVILWNPLFLLESENLMLATKPFHINLVRKILYQFIVYTFNNFSLILFFIVYFLCVILYQCGFIIFQEAFEKGSLSVPFVSFSFHLTYQSIHFLSETFFFPKNTLLFRYYHLQIRQLGLNLDHIPVGIGLKSTYFIIFINGLLC